MSNWIGPYKLKSLSSLVLGDDFSFPDGKIVYLVSLKVWKNNPTKDNSILYIGQSGGTNEHQARARLGALISNILGFYNIENNNRHKGGEAIFKYCVTNKITPFSLYISWKNSNNLNTEEKSLIKELQPFINQRNANKG
jgi:hypothetical protein